MEPEGEDDLPPPPELKLPDPSSIRPQSLTPIPDDPPPHEGSLFDLPIVVEPPDILVIQVLLALPGRPIEGEFLVRPDGTIHLGYYGILHVRGLALAQVKEKVVLRLRRFIRDEALGLWRKEEIDGGKYQWVTVPPQDVENIFVDVGTYNSTFYYIQGDVALAGRIPCTGHETIFDALVAAGGLVATANPRDITLVRPARGIQPSKTYKIDYEAITKRGDVRANLQVFPGDRIIVGRDPIAQATDQNNRRLAPFFTFMDSVKSYATALRSAKTVLKDLPLDPNERGAMVKDLVDLLWEVGHRADGAVLDEKTFKEAVSRHLNAVLESSPKEARDAKPEASKPSTP